MGLDAIVGLLAARLEKLPDVDRRTWVKSEVSRTAWPLTFTMTSPARNPLFSPRLPFSTERTRTPLPFFAPKNEVTHPGYSVAPHQSEASMPALVVDAEFGWVLVVMALTAFHVILQVIDGRCTHATIVDLAWLFVFGVI